MSLVKDQTKIYPGFSNAGGRKVNVLGGSLPIKDQFHRKVREAQEGYCGLLGRGSLLYKNLLYAFFFLQRNTGDVGSSIKTAKWGEEGNRSLGQLGEKARSVSLDGKWFICTLWEFLK